MRTFLTVILVAALGGGGWWFWQKRQAGAEAGSEPTRPRSAVVETRSIRFAVTAAGDIGPAEQVSVRPEVNGRIEVLTVDVGDFVSKDQLLFKLDDRELQTQKEQEEKNVIRSRLQLEQAQRNHDRASDLFASKLISQELYEDAKTQFEIARNDLARAANSLELIEERLRKTEVRAPFDCTVLTRPVSVGQAVSGSGGFNSGTEVMTIANLNDLVISAHINQADVTRLNVDQEVEVTVEAIPGLKLKGLVERLAPQSTIKNNIRGFAARILLRDADKQVRPGMTANITIPVASADDVVAAPLSSIFTETNPDTRQMERFVWVRQGTGWERRPVEIGVSDYFFVEVTRGLAAGDEVSLEDRSAEAKAAKGPASTASGKPSAGGGGAGSGSTASSTATSRPQTAAR